MTGKRYNLESYWDNVAQSINSRNNGKIIAGDDEPYYRYKRRKFLKVLDTIDFTNKRVLEVGSGPGGNLQYLSNKNCKELVGVDVSEKMIELSKEMLSDKNIQVFKTNGKNLPFKDNCFDLVFTSTVLQHNTDETQLKELIQSICRVSNSDVVLFERIEKIFNGHDTNVGRPIEYYRECFKEHDYTLLETNFLPIQVSYLVCGAIRKLFSHKDRKEGEPLSKTSLLLESILLPLTSIADMAVPIKRDVAMLYFRRM